MEKKTQESYTKVFTVVREQLGDWSPTTAMCDFEVASIRALTSVFPDSTLTGCFFHLSQSVYRQAVDRGLRASYVEDEVVRKHIKYLPALAFVPNEDVLDAFATIQESDEFPQENESIVDLYDYFETNYIGRQVRGGRRRQPRYSIDMWNQVQRMEQGIARTNNIVEGWHRGIQASLDGDHPSLWKFIKFLQTEEAWTKTTDEQITAGQTLKLEKQEQQSRTARLQNILADYANREILDYLRGISYNLNMPV
jgi:hypothetical protein